MHVAELVQDGGEALPGLGGGAVAAAAAADGGARALLELAEMQVGRVQGRHCAAAFHGRVVGRGGLAASALLCLFCLFYRGGRRSGAWLVVSPFTAGERFQ